MQEQVRWHPPGEPDPLHAHLAEHPGAIRVGRLCPRCGSSEHGGPWATRDGETVHVSLSRSGPHTVTVVAAWPVGVDVEEVTAVDARWQPDLVLAPGEQGDSGESGAIARTWAAKEAVLKLLGTGLDRPMTEVRLADFDVEDLPAPEGYVAVVARQRAGAAAPRTGATRRTGR